MNMKRGLCCLCVVLFCTTLVVMAVDPVFDRETQKIGDCPEWHTTSQNSNSAKTIVDGKKAGCAGQE